MGEYFIGSDGELYHWGWKKKDAKYIKRERKNGKWVYTYPEKTSTTNTKTNIGSKTTDTKSTNRLTNYISGIKKDIAESKERASKHKYDSPIENKFRIAKEYIKDRLGYDEKKQYESTKETYENTKKSVESTKKWYDDNYRKMEDAEREGRKEEAAERRALKDDIQKYLNDNRGAEWDAFMDNLEAHREYKDTVLYKVEKAGDALDRVLDDVGDNIRDFKDAANRAIKNGKNFVNNTVDDVSEKLADVAFDVSWEVEYQTKKALGLEAKERYEARLEIAQEVAKEYKRAENRYEKSSKDSYDQWLWEQAQKRYEDTMEATKEARDNYAKTPAGLIDIGHEYVEEWLESLKENRKKSR